MADTVQQWAEWTQTASDGLQDARQHVNTVLNDPTATTAEKNKAMQDIVIQENYVKWLEEQNAEIQQTGVVPSSMSIPSKTIRAGVWIDAADGNKVKTGTFENFANNQYFNTDRVHVADLDGVSIDLWIFSNTATTPNPRIQVAYFSGGSNYYDLGFICWNTDNDGSIIWRFGSSNSYYQSPSYPSPNKNGFCCFTRTGQTNNTHNGFANMARWSATTSPNYGESVTGPLTSVQFTGGPVDPNAPWDFFNDDILPGIDPDNAIIPEPYNPDPEKPDADKPELPGEGENGGPDIEPNDITGIGGGFGFLTQYAIRAADIEILGKLLWAGFRTGSQQDIDNYLMNFVYNVNADTGSLNFADIMEFFVSLKMYPFPLSNVATLTAHDHHIHVGAGYTAIGDNAALPHFPNIIYTMDSYVGKISAGSVELPFWFRDYRDYSIQITLYLPYCGTVELNPGDVMGGTLDCDYYIDFCTGSCTAYVTCTSWDGHRFPVASMPGQMGADVPMSATNAGRIAARIYSDRIDHVENMVGAFKALTTGAGAVMSGNYAGAVRQGFSAFIDPAINEEKLKAGMLDRGAIAAPVLSAGGGFTSFCNPSTCYVVYRSPCYPEIGNYPDSVGTPAAEQVTIGDCTGFCQFVNVDTSGITTDADTQKQIRDALAAGIYI